MFVLKDIPNQTVDDVVLALQQMNAPPPNYVVGPVNWKVEEGVVTVNGTAYFSKEDPTLFYREDHTNAFHLLPPVWHLSRLPMNRILQGYRPLAGQPTVINPRRITPPDTEIDLTVRVFDLAEEKEGHITCDVLGTYNLNGRKLATVYAPGHILRPDIYEKVVRAQKFQNGS